MKRNSFKELGEKLRKLMDSVPKMREQIIAGIEQNISDAADMAVLAARQASPHPNDGKRRGFNVITGELAAHWSWRYVKENSGSKQNLFGAVYLYNDTSYASFVQNGHVMHKHFVPWLYIDAMGTISYETNHNLPMFGLVVGTRTKYVEGRDMTGPALKAFDETFKKLTEDLLQEVLKAK